MKKLQTILNLAARYVTGVNHKCSTKKLMDKCKWLSVRQLVTLHSVTLLWKVLQENGPQSLKTYIEIDKRPIRGLGSHRLYTAPVKLACNRNCWRIWAVHWFNALPESLRTEKNLGKFKKGLRNFVIVNVLLKY